MDVVLPPEEEQASDTGPDTPEIRRVQSKSPSWWKKRLIGSVGVPEALSPSQQQEVHNFLTEHHNVFALEEYERGETSLVEMEIDTGDAHPCRCAPKRVPFAVRAEMARQIHHMQVAKDIQQAASPWPAQSSWSRRKMGLIAFALTTGSSMPSPKLICILCHVLTTCWINWVSVVISKPWI